MYSVELAKIRTRLGVLVGTLAVVGFVCSSNAWATNRAASGTLGTYSLFSLADNSTANVANNSDSVEVGVRLRSSTAGELTAVRFLKAPNDPMNTHQVTVWSACGQQLATATSNNETASGWQTAALAKPLRVKANTTFVVGYHTTHLMMTDNYFQTEVRSGPLSLDFSRGTR